MGGITQAYATKIIGKDDFKDAVSGHFVRDPLSEVTRKERRTLLAVSAVGTVMVKANIVPQKISALGIDFGEINKTILLRSIALLAIYFLVAFSLYAVSDFLAWRIAIQHYLLELSTQDEGEAIREAFLEDTVRKRALYIDRLEKLGCLAKPLSFLRASFEFLFPIVFAIYAIVVLFNAPA
jgi:hypothetical protein